MRPVLAGSAHRFAIFRPPPCFTGRGAGEGRLRATSGLSHGQAEGQSVTQSGRLVNATVSEFVKPQSALLRYGCRQILGRSAFQLPLIALRSLRSRQMIPAQ